MSTLMEQLSAVRKSQVETQLNFFQNFTARAVESAQKIVALNLNLSRASMEKSSAAMTELLSAKDPRDLFALTKRTQETVDSLLAYNRELLAITTGSSAALVQTALAATPSVPALPQAFAPEAAAAAAAEAPKPAAALDPVLEVPVAEFVAPVAEPEVAAPAPALPETQAKVTPMAKAVSKVASKPVAVKPTAAPVPAANKPVVVTGIKPVDAAPPPAPVSGKPALAQQQLELPTAKAKKKK